MNTFYQQSGIPLDPVYTAKMLWGLKELFNSGQLSSDQRVLAIHTGGLQGIAGMNQKLEKKQWPRILDPSE
jgi:1-aminocyclopropane-1-carboxylate deaminase